MSGNERDQLLVFTVDFPYGPSELTFLPGELEQLSKFYSKIFLVPLRTASQSRNLQLPPNVHVINIIRTTHRSNLKDYFFLCRILLREWRSNRKIDILKHGRMLISQLKTCLSLAKDLLIALKAHQINIQDLIFYSYWFDEWVTVSSIIKMRYEKDILLVSRAHGYDLYEDRNSSGYIFPRKTQLQNISKIFTVSRNGAEYLKEKYPSYNNFVEYSRLGVYGIKSPTNFPKESNHFEIRVVSCSQIIPLKRLDKIIEVLTFTKKKIQWIHFGDGPLMQSISKKSQTLGKNVTVNFRGNQPNESIRDFYSKNKVDWFINLSDYEGIPVSIMEAISCGIPILALNVGGISEIVTPETGHLFEKDSSPAEISLTLEKEMYTGDQRQEIVKFWRLNYSAEDNYLQFARKLKSIE